MTSTILPWNPALLTELQHAELEKWETKFVCVGVHVDNVTQINETSAIPPTKTLLHIIFLVFENNYVIKELENCAKQLVHFYEQNHDNFTAVHVSIIKIAGVNDTKSIAYKFSANTNLLYVKKSDAFTYKYDADHDKILKYQLAVSLRRLVTFAFIDNNITQDKFYKNVYAIILNPTDNTVFRFTYTQVRKISFYSYNKPYDFNPFFKQSPPQSSTTAQTSSQENGAATTAQPPNSQQTTSSNGAPSTSQALYVNPAQTDVSDAAPAVSAYGTKTSENTNGGATIKYPGADLTAKIIKKYNSWEIFTTITQYA